MALDKKKYLTTLTNLVFLLCLVGATFLTVSAVQQRQDTRSKAASKISSTTQGTNDITGLVTPSILGFQSDLFTGAATVSYPVSVPSGLGGLKPNLSLSYSSSSVDDGHRGIIETDWRRYQYNQAANVGLGWNLNGIDNISRSGDHQDYYLTVSGISYKLYADTVDDQGHATGTSWHTNPKSFLTISHVGETSERGNTPWYITDTSGNQYIFGEVPEHRAWFWRIYDTSNGTAENFSYKWMISRVTDLRGNQINYSYNQESHRIVFNWTWENNLNKSCENTDVRDKIYISAIYPKTISWTTNQTNGLNPHYQVIFNYEPRDDYRGVWWAKGEDADGNEHEGLKSCTQAQYTTNRLNQIQVMVDNQPMRSYQFGYHYETVMAGDSYSTWVAIKHSILDKITALGSGTNSLPPYNFTYEDTGNATRLKTADNGYGGKVTFNYQSVRPLCADKDNAGKQCEVDDQLKFRVTEKITEDGQGNRLTNKINYSDTGKIFDKNEFVGYAWVESVLYEKDGTTVINKTKNYYHQLDNDNIPSITKWWVDPRKGKTTKTEILDKDNHILTLSSEKWLYDQKPTFRSDGKIDWAPWRPFTYLEEKTSTFSKDAYLNFLLGIITNGITTKTTYVYDKDSKGLIQSYGNLKEAIEHGDTGITGDERRTTTDYVYNTTKNILSKPKTTTFYKRQGSDQWQEISSNRYAYDNKAWGEIPDKGEVTQAVNIAVGETIPITTSTAYDLFGNPITTTDAKGKITTTTYDLTYHQYPVRVENPLGHSVTTEYNYLLGLPTKVTDPNGFSTRFEYDSFGRATKIFKAGEGTPSTEYLIKDYLQTTTGSKPGMTVGVKNKANESSYLESYQFYNGLGQVIESQSLGPSDGQLILTHSTYNSRGAAEEVTAPYFIQGTIGFYLPDSRTNPQKTTTQYDALGRAVKTTNTDGTFITSNYTGYTTTVINEANVKTISTTDAWGKTVKVEEYNSTVSDNKPVYATTTSKYDYGLGVLTETKDTKGNVSTITYDNFGRKKSVSDPDLGNWQYLYDLNGNIVEQQDAKGQKITLAYDDLNRLIKKTYPDSTYVTFQYDEGGAAAFALGKQTKMIDSSGSTKPEYDLFGHVIRETKEIKINGEENFFTTSYAYDNLDRLTSMTYPDGETVSYTYNRAGQPQSLTSGTANIARITAYNEFGQVLGEENGPSEATFYYDNFGRGIFEEKSLIKNTYEYRTDNHRLNRSDGYVSDNLVFSKSYAYDSIGNITAIVDNLSGAASEAYTYDKFNRLLTASLNNQLIGEYNYDEISNLTNKKEGDEALSLSYNNQGPVHAPKNVKGVAYTYDANGNLTKDEARLYTYDFENRVKGINLTSPITTPTPSPIMSSPTVSPGPTVTPAPVCPGSAKGNLDCSFDGCVNDQDLFLFKTSFGRSLKDLNLSSGIPPDWVIDTNSQIDTADYEILRNNYNQCFP